MSDTKKPGLELQSIIDSHSNPFVLVDENYNIVAANKAYCTAYGTAPEKVVGCKCHKVSHHFDTPCFENNEDCPLDGALSTNKTYEVLHIHFDQNDQPEHVRIKGHPITGADGKRYVGEEVIRLAKTTDLDCEEQRLIGRSPAFRQCIEGLTRIAGIDANVLLQGERGVGKTLAAQYLHRRSSRSGRPFVSVDCRTINETMFERELFGHERGAFAGCVGRRHGWLDQADGGTLFLNSISEIPLAVQGRLAATLDTGYFRRVGGREMLKTHVRVISASCPDLLALIDAGKFRSDLYYAVAGVTQTIPSLRERRDDIVALADATLVRICNGSNRYCHIREDAREKLQDYGFPGNMPELRNILQKAVSLSTEGTIKAEHILLSETPRFDNGTGVQTLRPASASMKEREADYIVELLERHGGHRRKVSEDLGISERTLYRKIKQYQLEAIGKRSTA